MDVSSFKLPEKGKPTRIHSELHEFVAFIRKDFGETAKTGVGSFGFYLRLLKVFPLTTLRAWHAGIRDSPKLSTPEARRRVFWWTWKKNKAPIDKKGKTC